MAWMSKPDAARALGISTRTLARRLADGKYNTKFDGRRILVCVPDKTTATRATPSRAHTEKIAPAAEHIATIGSDHADAITEEAEHVATTATDRTDAIAEAAEHVATTGRQLVEIAASAAIQKKHDADMVAATSSAINEIHEVLEMLQKEVVTARQDANRALTARQRAYRTLRWISGAAAVLVLAAIIAVAWFEQHHRQVAEAWADELHQVKTSLASTEARAEGESSVLQAELAAQRERSVQTITELQDHLAAAKDQAKAVADAASRQLTALRLELDLVRRERHDAQDERRRLANEITALRPTADEPPPRLSLRELIDESWSSVKPSTSEPSNRTPASVDQVSSR